MTFEGHELHGGIGWSTEYDLQLYFRRRLAEEKAFGSTALHMETVARAIDAGTLPVPHAH